MSQDKAENDGVDSPEKDREFSRELPVPATNRLVIYGVVGFSCYWAWFYLTCFSDIVILPMPVELHIEPLFRCVAFLAASLVLFGVLCLRRQLLSKTTGAAWAVAPVAASSCLYLVTSSVLDTQQMHMPLEIAAWLLFGAAYALVSIQSGFFLATIKEKDSLFFIGISASLGAFIYLTVDALEGHVALFTTMVLPLVATVFFLVARVVSSRTGTGSTGEVSAERQSVREWVRDSQSIMPYQLLFGIVFGFAIGVAISLGMDDFGNFSWMIITAFCLPGPLLLFFHFRASRSLLQFTSRWVLPLMAIMLLPLPFVGYSLRIVFCGLLVFGFVWYDLVHLQAVGGLMQAQKDSALAIYCSRRMFVLFGIFVGHILSWLLLIFSGLSGQAFSLAVVGITALMILFIPLVNAGKDQKTIVVTRNTGPGESRALEDVCQEICERAQLSPRQSEVFTYLAKGRNAAFIENELVVSNHTVKAHIYRIYQKLGIHSQQELIDVVDKMMSK
ncbi:MAG: helix-turn-helix transcriptional regulator [Coriobacteriales bacterium]|jgi:DNA-binding CsgD family transcriptional regulator|nr:helix-turn-helix transcriptional regulator [Coriobacteriales bacterium]